MDLKAKLVQMRKEKGLSQLELAEKLNVSRQAISRWELGTAVPSTDNLKSLCALFGVSLDYLLCDGTSEPSKDVQIQEITEIKKSRSVSSWKRIGIFVLAAIAIGILAAGLFPDRFGKNEDVEIILPMNGMEGDEINTNRESDFHLNW